jgi:hypothetical protein
MMTRYLEVRLVGGCVALGFLFVVTHDGIEVERENVDLVALIAQLLLDRPVGIGLAQGLAQEEDRGLGVGDGRQDLKATNRREAIRPRTKQNRKRRTECESDRRFGFCTSPRSCHARIGPRCVGGVRCSTMGRSLWNAKNRELGLWCEAPTLSRGQPRSQAMNGAEGRARGTSCRA